jgi:carbon-monoxide dehydrogenase large subunit
MPPNCRRAWSPGSIRRISVYRRHKPFRTAATSWNWRSITGVVSIDRYTAVDDFGRTINPLLLEGQVHGGIALGIGQALLEHTVYDPEDGQLLTGSFTDYAMPRAGDLPIFAFSTHNVPSTANPLGVKGAGEAGAVGAPPAVINAVVDALSHRIGLRHIDMPATPRRVWGMLNGEQ